MSAPTWLPDWTDAGAYPNADDLHPEQWAWEFLRRNPDYQRTFLEKHDEATGAERWGLTFLMDPTTPGERMGNTPFQHAWMFAFPRPGQERAEVRVTMMARPTNHSRYASRIRALSKASNR